MAMGFKISSKQSHSTQMSLSPFHLTVSTMQTEANVGK